LSIFNLGKIDGPGIPVYLRGEFIVSRKGVHDERVLLQNLHQVLIDLWGSTSLEFQVLKLEPCSVKLEILGSRIAIPKSLNHLTPGTLEPSELTDLILFSDLCEEKEEKEALVLMMATMKHNRLRPRIGSRSSPPKSPPEKTSQEIDSVQPTCSLAKGSSAWGGIQVDLAGERKLESDQGSV
jgi:hypothetical protein